VVARFFKFHLSSIVSPTIIVIVTNALTAATGWPPYFSAAVGVLLGFGWNWTMNSLIIWPSQSRDLPNETPV
jgi:putative flippase GtrA